MQKALRVTGIIVGVILVIALILGGVWLGISRRAYPRTRGTVELQGLTAPVEIYRDRYGVPHIYAQTAEDLFFAQGYVHAQDRYWQMEFWRRIGAGRLSEFFGEATLSSDIFLRTMGFARIAEQEYALADPETRRALEAYAAGVNAYTQSRRPAQLGLEFALLQWMGVEVEIEPWTPINTLTWAKVMAYDLGGNMEDEIRRVELIRAVGLDMAADLLPTYRDDMPYIVPDEELDYLSGSARNAGDLLAHLDDVNTRLVGGFDPARSLALGRGEGIGSNNWVLSGDLTDTGAPILANDPHLGIQMPSIWYEIGLHCVEKTPDCPFEVRGYSFAGAPGVIIGHNDRIAWGMTNVNPDVQDLYIERINPANPNQYEVNGEWVDMDLIPEEIIVQGEDEPYFLMVRYTRHGPIVTDMESMQDQAGFTIGPPGFPEGLEFTALSLQWTALQPVETFRAILLLDKAQNYEDFREALQYFTVPSQNFVYADVEGNIGYQMPGQVPIRAGGDGSLPAPGWTDDYEWVDFIPYDDLPRAYNPTQGYIVTANNPVVSPEYPYLIMNYGGFDHGYRARRIVEMIEEHPDGISLDDVATMQGDNLNLSALEILPYLEGLSFEDPALAEARDRLLAWDGQMHMDSPEAALYGYFWVALLSETFHDQLPEDLWPGGGSRTMVAVYWLLQEPDNPWWDDLRTPDVTETRDDILARALEKGYADGVEVLGERLDAWRWGDVHTATFANQTFGESGIGPIEAIFNRGPVAASGGTSIVNATSWSVDEPFLVNSVPSMRQIIDLGDLTNSRMMHTTGQSGHPGHRHYDDFIDPWRFIEYHPTLWDRAEVEASARELLTLRPAE
ncbi:MAG TPA: penicillin acylase family protein [Chloroflexi bacterium]|nr:penicillin acylase family protein [Chloroflexota bacterium]